MDINVVSAVLFVLIASCFLVVVYELMSYWFVELLVVLFCIGGVEVCESSLSTFYLLYMCAKLVAKRNIK